MTYFTLLTYVLAFLAGCGFVVVLALLQSAKGNADEVQLDAVHHRRLPAQVPGM